MKFLNDYILENSRVLLRPLQNEDANHLAPVAVNEPKLWTYTLSELSTKNNLADYIKKAIDGRNKQKVYPYCVFDKKLQKYAGCTRLYNIDIDQKTASIGYTWYGKEFQGTGLNKNCKYLLLNFAFEELQMERIEFRADSNNTRSICAIKSLGCSEEGVLRSNKFRPDGSRRSSIVLSILKEEWFGFARQNLKNKIDGI